MPEVIMRLANITLLALAVCIGLSHPVAAQQSNTADKASRMALVQEFIRELEVIYRLQQGAKTELAENPSTEGKLMTSIRVSARTVSEMGESAIRLDMISIAGQWAQFRDLLKQTDQKRAALMQEMSADAKALLQAPQPGVNYGAMMARAPEITASVEELDKNMFTMSQAMFFALVDDQRLSADGKLHHLIVAAQERDSMVHLIDSVFGAALVEKNTSYIVTAASIIKYGLTRPIYRPADEP